MSSARGTRRGLPPESDGKVCSSGECSVITQPAWSTVQEQKLRSWQRQTMSAAGDRMAEGILQSAAFQRGIDAGVASSAGKIRSQDRATG
jgi:hypothetical protein